MQKYIVTGRYTPLAVEGMLSNPSDREAAARQVVEAGGGTLVGFYVTTGEKDFLMIIESDDPKKILAGLMVASGSGVVSRAETIMAFTSAEMTEIQAIGQGLASVYETPGI